jgi:hypothetical protein
MPSGRAHRGYFTGTLVVLLMLLLVSAAPAFASAKIRFVHAVPGAGAAKVTVSSGGSQVATSAVTFGNSSSSLEVPAGKDTFELTPAAGGAALAKLTETVADGTSYTLVAMAKPGDKGVALKLYEDAKPRSGKALFRLIHANPELGEPDVKVGDEVVAEKVPYTQATDWIPVSPGAKDVSIWKPGGKGQAMAVTKGVPLTAGTATTAVVVGSRGEPTRIVILSDTAAPPGAPQTGLGGMAQDGAPSRWLVALLSALAAGALGAAAWVVAGRR